MASKQSKWHARKLMTTCLLLGMAHYSTLTKHVFHKETSQSWWWLPHGEVCSHFWFSDPRSLSFPLWTTNSPWELLCKEPVSVDTRQDFGGVFGLGSRDFPAKLPANFPYHFAHHQQQIFVSYACTSFGASCLQTRTHCLTMQKKKMKTKGTDTSFTLSSSCTYFSIRAGVGKQGFSQAKLPVWFSVPWAN